MVVSVVVLVRWVRFGCADVFFAGGYGEPGKEKQLQRRKDHEETWKKGSLAERMATQESSI